MKLEQATRLPKRLVALLLLLAIGAILGLVAQHGVLFCALILLMVIAVLGRQRMGLYLFRGYSIAQLGLTSLLPINLFSANDLAALASVINLDKWPVHLLLTGLILFSTVQVWVAFNGKVSAYCHIKNSMNIMR